jgi:hypothetical protein
MRTTVAAVAWFGFAAYSIAWLVVALTSDPAWWWFMPVYGDIKIFQASLWWELFHVGVFPLLILVGAIMGAFMEE